MDASPALAVHLVVPDAREASAWYCRAFEAYEAGRIELIDGRLIHVDLRIGSARFMLADEFPEHGALAPRAGHGAMPVFYLQSDDVDTLWQRAADAGAEITRPLSDAVWGERDGQLRDPYGYCWGLSQRLRDIPEAELAAIVRDAFASTPSD